MAGRAAMMIVYVLHAFALALTCQVSIAPASADDTSAEAGRLESGPHSFCEVRIRRRGSASSAEIWIVGVVIVGVTEAITIPEASVSTLAETTITSKMAVTEAARVMAAAEAVAAAESVATTTAMGTTTPAATAASHKDNRSIVHARLGVRQLSHRRCRRADHQHRAQSGARQY